MFCYQFDTYMATIPIPEQQSKTQKKFCELRKTWRYSLNSKLKNSNFESMDGLREVRSYVIHWAKLTFNKLGILCIQQNLGKSLNKNIDKNIDALCKQTICGMKTLQVQVYIQLSFHEQVLVETRQD